MDEPDFGDLVLSSFSYVYNLLGNALPFIGESVVFGSFSLLAILSAYLLIRKGLHVRSHLVMLLAIVTMYTVATTHWALGMAWFLGDVDLFGGVYSDVLSCPSGRLADFEPCLMRVLRSFSDAQTRGPTSTVADICVPTALLSVNIILSDSIVLWRAWILWGRRRAIRALSVALVAALFAISIVDTQTTCSYGSGEVIPLPGGLYLLGTRFGLAAVALSWVTNLCTTSLIGIKAWQHRRFIKEHLKDGTRRTRAEKIMALLIESGTIYCLIWTFLVAIELFNVIDPASLSSVGEELYTVGMNLFQGALIQVIGIYPTIVSVLVALEKTHCDRYFSYDKPVPVGPELALPHITVTVSSPGETFQPVPSGISPGSSFDNPAFGSISEDRHLEDGNEKDVDIGRARDDV